MGSNSIQIFVFFRSMMSVCLLALMFRYVVVDRNNSTRSVGGDKGGKRINRNRGKYAAHLQKNVFKCNYYYYSLSEMSTVFQLN